MPTEERIYPLFALFHKDKGVGDGSYRLVVVEKRDSSLYLKAFLCNFGSGRLRVKESKAKELPVGAQHLDQIDKLVDLDESLIPDFSIGKTTFKEVKESFKEIFTSWGSTDTVIFSEVEMEEFLKKKLKITSYSYYSGRIEEFEKRGREHLDLVLKAPELKISRWIFDLDEGIIEEEISIVGKGEKLTKFLEPKCKMENLRILFERIVLSVDGAKKEVKISPQGLPMDGWRVFVHLKWSEGGYKLKVFLKNTNHDISLLERKI